MMSFCEKKPLGVYIHWPFCLSICPYCDFNRFLYRPIDWQSFEKAYFREMDFFLQKTPSHQVKTIFFGGGTPSLMQPSWVFSLIQGIYQRWSVHKDVEITLEVNPTSAEVCQLSDFKKAGVNRISMGLQSLSDETLQFLGRKHTSKEGIKALSMITDLFEKFSFDLIFGHTYHQKLSAWQEELAQAIVFARSHLSLYQLTFEKGTPFYQKYQAGHLKALPEDHLADLYEWTDDFMQDKGFYAYEVSNYALPLHECQHNLIYWKSQDHIGLGPGAHGRLFCMQTQQREGFANEKKVENWMRCLEDQGQGFLSKEILSEKDFHYERLLMGLRLQEGVPIAFMQNVNLERKKRLIDLHLAFETKDRFALTASGRRCLDSVLSYLL